MYLMPLFRLLKTGDTATSPQKRREKAVANLEVAAHVATKLTPEQVERQERIKRLQASERVLIGAQIARDKAEAAAMDRRRGVGGKVEATLAHAAAWGAGEGAATALKRAPLRKATMVSSRGVPQELSRFNTNSLLALFRTHAPLNRLTFDHFNSVLVTGVGVNGFDLERASRPLFSAFAGGEDTVDYRPILCSLRPIDRPTDTVRQTLMWSFDCFDSEGTGYLSRDDIFRVCLAAATDGDGVEQIEAAVGAIFGGDDADLVAQQSSGYSEPETLVSRSMFEMLLAAHLELELLLRKQFLLMMPAKAVSAQYEASTDRAIAEIDKRVLIWKWERAKAFWRPNAMRKCFHKWAILIELHLNEIMAEIFFGTRMKQRAVRKMRELVALTKRQTWLEDAAQHMREHAVVRKYYPLWMRVVWVNRRHAAWGRRKARAFYAIRARREAFDAWREAVENVHKYAAAVALFKRRLTFVWYLQWVDNTQLCITLRERAEAKAAMRTKIMAQEYAQTLMEFELKCMRAEEKYTRDLAAEIERLRVEKLAAAEYERKKEELRKAYVKRKIEHDQEESRQANKAAKKKHDKANFEEQWIKIRADALLACREQTIHWLNNEMEGNVRLAKDQRFIYQKWDDNVVVENVPNCLWVQHYDDYAGLSFWYNDDTHEKIGLRAFDQEHARDIALERYVAEMVNEEKRTLDERKAAQNQERMERGAALMMQGKLRVQRAKKMMRDLCDVIYLKRYDPYTGKAFYLNLRTKQAQMEKPLLLGREDVTQPDWFEKCVHCTLISFGELLLLLLLLLVCLRRLCTRGLTPVSLSLPISRFDDNGTTVYYVPRTRPWDRHYEKPAGLITCGICLQFFAIRFCDDCTELGSGWFCYDCHQCVLVPLSVLILSLCFIHGAPTALHFAFPAPSAPQV